MAKVTSETVQHVANLARLSLTEEERSTFALQLDDVLSYAEAIQKLELADVPPMSHAGTVERFREDSPAGELPHEKVVAAAPDPAERLFRVPKVLGG